MLRNGTASYEPRREGYLADVEHATWVAYLVHGRDSSVVGGLVIHSITPVGPSRELAPSWDDGRPPRSQGSQQTCTNPPARSFAVPMASHWGHVRTGGAACFKCPQAVMRHNEA